MSILYDSIFVYFMCGPIEAHIRVILLAGSRKDE